MPDAFIYDHVRTPRGRGKKDGGLHEVTALESGDASARRNQDRNELDTVALIDDVVLGVVDPVGEEAADTPAPPRWWRATATDVPGVQINRFCASGLDAVNFAAAQMIAGGEDRIGKVDPSPGRHRTAGAHLVDQSIDRASRALFIPPHFRRPDRDQIRIFPRRPSMPMRWRAEKRAAAAWDEGRFNRSVMAVKDINGLTILAKDEHMRPGTTMQSLAALSPSFVQMGELGGFDAVAIQAHPDVEYVNHVHVHAGNSSGIVDGAAAVLVGNARAGRRAGLKPRAKIKAFANIGSEPALMLTGPVDVTKKC